MKTDPIIDEVRRVREAHSEKCGHDLVRIAADIRKGEEQLRQAGWRLVDSVAGKQPALTQVKADR